MPSRHHLIEVADTVVGDADRARVSELVRSLHTRPGPGRTALGPVDDVQVDVVDAEPPQAPFSFVGGVLVCGIELGGDEHLVAGHAALSQTLPDALLVAIVLSG